MIVDAHMHVGGPPERRASADQMAELMADCGIDRAVVFPAPDLFPKNEAMARDTARHPDKFILFAWLNPHAGKDAVLELERLVRDYGFQGIKLQPVLHAFYPTHKAVRPLMDRASELGLPVVIHSGDAPFSLPWEIGDLAELYPNTTIIMAHMGLRPMNYVEGAIRVAGRYPNIILDVTAMNYYRKIKDAVTAVGADRVVFGTDSPSFHPAPGIRVVRLAGLTPEDEAKVLGGSILKILSRKGGP